MSTYRKVWFAKGEAKTAGLIVTDAWIEEHKRNFTNDVSRLFPMSECTKMGRLHVSPPFPSYEQALSFETHGEKQ